MNDLSDDLDLVASSTIHLWSELRRQRIFITGGTGFIGCWLVETFCHVNRYFGLDAQAVILTRNPDAFARKCPHLASDPAVSLWPGDVRSFQFPDGDFGFVIHAATEASPKQATEQPLEMLSTIIAGTERALQFASARGATKVLLTSSGAVYGKQPSSMAHVPETYLGGPDPLDPISVYAEGKRAAELLCSVYAGHNKLECKIGALLGILWAVSSSRSALRNRQLHRRCSGRPAYSHLRRRHAQAFLTCMRPTLRPGSGHCFSRLPRWYRSTSARIVM